MEEEVVKLMSLEEDVDDDGSLETGERINDLMQERLCSLSDDVDEKFNFILNSHKANIMVRNHGTNALFRMILKGVVNMSAAPDAVEAIADFGIKMVGVGLYFGYLIGTAERR